MSDHLQRPVGTAKRGGTEGSIAEPLRSSSPSPSTESTSMSSLYSHGKSCSYRVQKTLLPYVLSHEPGNKGTDEISGKTLRVPRRQLPRKGSINQAGFSDL